ncbi:MAG: hypothetical protein GZ085_01225 [Sulfuriferula multivorans]|uniref:DUF883 family protein n=1 Tax=Sulfuriferula multivorans TaxID=1559896 RepID=A0A7C9JVA7_9PROT|nr:hypothetical protein [Sulfuriferula multivorans]
MEPTSFSKNTQDLADEISGSSTAEHARRSIDEARAGANDLVNHSSEALRQGATRAREAIAHTTDQAAQYVQAQPLKSLLMALAAGAGIVLLANAFSKHHHERN